MAKCIRKDRVRLLSNNVETLLFLEYNFRAACHSTSMLEVHDDFIPRNDRIYDTLDSDME